MLAICAAQWPGIGLDGIFGTEATYVYQLVLYTFGCQGWHCITVSWRFRKNKPTAKDKRTTARCMRILRLFLRLYVKDRQRGSQSLWKTCLGNRRKEFLQHASAKAWYDKEIQGCVNDAVWHVIEWFFNTFEFAFFSWLTLCFCTGDTWSTLSNKQL